MSAAFRVDLERLRAGEIEFDVFARSTHRVWSRFARYLMRRWRAPLDVGQVDLEQELMVAGWTAVAKWDPAYGVPIDRYVTFNSIDKAKKWLHKQRDAKRRDDNSPSRHAITFTGLGCETPEDVDRIAWSPCDAEEQLLEAERRSQMGAAISRATYGMTARELVCLDAIAECGGNLEAAVVLIMGDVDRRLEMRLSNDLAIESVVRMTARALIERLQAQQEAGGLS